MVVASNCKILVGALASASILDSADAGQRSVRSVPVGKGELWRNRYRNFVWCFPVTQPKVRIKRVRNRGLARDGSEYIAVTDAHALAR